MRYKVQLLISILLPNFSLFILPSITHAKSMIEPCSSSDSCSSLLSYFLPYDSKLSEIAYRFQLNISGILAANSINPITQSVGNQIFHAKTFLKIPISCPCVDGIRRSISTRYTVQAADTVDSISNGFGGLVSAEQIRDINGINAKNPLTSGQTMVIPLPCTCFNNSNNGVTTVYMSYVVRKGESLSNIGMEFGTTVTDLEAINGLEQEVVDPGDILAVPIPACSSSNLNWYNESLMVPNGSFALTANNCIKCICGPGDLNLRCSPSGIEVSCSHLQCKGSELSIGDVYIKQTIIGCNVSACVYRGHNGRKIFRSLVNSSQIHCSGTKIYNAGSPTPIGSPSSSSPVVPSVTLSPSPSPSPSPSTSSSSNSTTGINDSNPTSKQNSNVSSDGGLFSQVSCYYSLLLLDLVLPFIL